MVKVSLSKAALLAVVVALSVLLIARDVFSYSLHKFVYLGICAMGILLTDKNSFMQLLSFIFPLMCGLPGTYVLLVAVARFAVVEKFDKQTMLYILFVVMFEMVASIWYNTTLDNNMMHQMLAVSLLFIMLHNHEGIDYYQCLKMYWLGSIIVAFVIICSTLMNAPSNWLSLFAKGWFRFGEDALSGRQTMTLRLNANTLAYYSLVSTMFGLIMIEREKRIKRAVIFVGTIFLMLSGILTVSRSWILIVSGCYGLYFLSRIKDIRYFIASCCAVALVVGAGIRLFETVPELMNGITARMTDKTVSSGGGRAELVVQYLGVITRSIRIASIGVGTTYPMEVLGFEDAVHNGTIQILVSYGILGSVVFFNGILNPLRNKTENKAPFSYCLPFIGCVLFIQTIQFINPAYLIFPYVISVYAVFEGRSYMKQYS